MKLPLNQEKLRNVLCEANVYDYWDKHVMNLDMFATLVKFYDDNPAIFIINKYIKKWNLDQQLKVLKTHPKFNLTPEIKKLVQDSGYANRLLYVE